MATLFERQFARRSYVAFGVLALAGVLAVVYIIRRRRK
jgi:hypothetical protein